MATLFENRYCSTNNVHKRALKMAEIFRHFVIENHLTRAKTISVQAWAKPFQQIIDLDGENWTTLELVLKWYMDNYKGQYTPKAYSPTTFRKKFPKMKAAWSKTCNLAEYEAKAQVVVNRVERLGWPIDLQTELMPAVCRSLKFLEQMESIFTKTVWGERDNALYQHLSKTIGEHEEFLVYWFERGWSTGDSWSAATMETGTNTRFRNMLAKWVLEYGATYTDFERLLERIELVKEGVMPTVNVPNNNSNCKRRTA